MSLSCCRDCGIVEGNTEFMFDEEAGCEVRICGLCGEETHEIKVKEHYNAEPHNEHP
jgi:hypothetical protein